MHFYPILSQIPPFCSEASNKTDPAAFMSRCNNDQVSDVRIKFDSPDTSVGRDAAAEKPYPSWDEMMSRLRRDRLGLPQSPASAPQSREWHDLVADMILKRD